MGAASKRAGLGLAGVVLLTLTGCGSGPHLKAPAPGAEHYTLLKPKAIYGVSPFHAWVAGSLVRQDGLPEGLILTSEDGGRSWERCGFEAHDLRDVTFQSVTFGDRLRGLVGGIRKGEGDTTTPIVFRTTDGGNHWREVRLPMGLGEEALAVHDITLDRDTSGTLKVLSRERPTGKFSETTYVSDDAGRSWQVAEKFFRHDLGNQAPLEQVLSMPTTSRGYRLVKGDLPGVTYVEVTGSGGQDWVPVHEMKLSALPTYYYPHR